MRVKLWLKVAAVLVTWMLSAWAYAADGVSEINQTCALNGGCFPGDSAGFPVTITQSGSYRLTGNLDLSGIAPVTAVQVSAPAVHLDLGGFEIIGPTTCTGSGSAISCDPTGPEQGVEFFTASIASSVRNGTIRGFGDSGIAASPEGIRISDITSMHNGNDGFAAVRSALIESCVAMENGGDGFDSDRGSVLKDLISIGNGNHGIEIDDVVGVVSGSTSQSNGGRGFNIVALSKFGQDNVSNFNGMEDNCGGGICTPQRRYYQTQGTFTGSQALTACADGFHMASIWEILDISNLTYDVKLGRVSDDSGSGPPSALQGWVRTGYESTGNATALAGISNCDAWTSDAGLLYGSTARPSSSGWEPGQQSFGAVAPWIAFTLTCNLGTSVWCVED